MKMNLILAAFVMLATVAFACDCGDYNVSFNSVTQLPNGKYNWSYTVCHYSAYDIKYVMIETCICKDRNLADCIYSFGDGSGQSNMKLNYTFDSTTGITGLKFYDLNSFSGCKKFWFVTNENYDQINANGGIKVNNYNLVCNYTVKTPKHPPVTAPEFPSAAVPLVVAVGALSAAYLLRKRS